MPTIRIPEDITVTIDGKEHKVTFVEKFIENRTEDPAALKTAADLYKSFEIRQAFAGKKAGDEVALSDTLYQHLKPVVEAPTGGYGPFMLQGKTFIDAILKPKES